MRIWPPSDLPVIITGVHKVCFNAVRDESINPTPKSKQGHIPFNAHRIIYGKRLPIIGRHPYALEVWEQDKSYQYWAHANCIYDTMAVNKR